jgi:hypothetical protein
VTLEGENVEADLALKTITRLLARNSSKPSTIRINMNGCSRLTDRGLAVIARTCPQLQHLEARDCVSISNGGLMDLVSRCQMISHLDVAGENYSQFQFSLTKPFYWLLLILSGDYFSIKFWMFQDAKWFQQFACTNHRRLPHTEIPKES